MTAGRPPGGLVGPPDVLVLGEANPDLVLRGDVRPRFGQTEQLLDAAELVLGGSGAITAHGLARLGVRVGLLGEIGDDVYGAFVRDRLEDAGVDVSALRVGLRPTGLTVVLCDGPDRTMLTLVGAVDADPPDWRQPQDVPQTRHLHLSSFFLQPRRAAELPRLLPLVRAAGVSVSLDTNADPQGRYAGLDDVLPHVDHLLPNRDEVLGIARSVLGMRGEDPVAAARALADLGPTVVVKDGDRGAIIAGPGEEVQRVPITPVHPVDTTGAGDTFDAAYLAAVLDGVPVRAAVHRACVAGSRAVGAAGGTGGQPTRATLDAAVRASR